jgi:outer membrane protein assembly factor BamD
MMRRSFPGGGLPGAVLVLLLYGCVGGMPKVPATPEAVLARADEYQQRGKNYQATALYQEFLNRYAGHDRAAYAQFRLAETHFDDGDYTQASIDYQILMSSYGYSEHVEEALYKLGLCYWLETPRSQRDQQKSFDALSRFLQYQQTYPDGVHATDVSKLLREIHEQLAKKDFDAARWYFRQKNGRAAMVYCDKIIENHPDNLYWARALLMKGEILLRRGQNEEAIQQFTRVVDYPGHPEIRREAQEKIREARR